MQKTKIEWTDYTWNPVTGCLHNCPYCYAKRIAMRFDGHFKPRFRSGRLNDKMPKKPSKIFVCSMSDLFGDWVKKEWIDAVLKVVNENPQQTFQFLTKNPKRYSEFTFPQNCWLGVTIDYPNQGKIDELKKKDNYKFISFEPLLGDMSGLDLSGIDWVIVGAMTGSGAIKPRKEWIDNIKHKNIFYKKNLLTLLIK
jgi:protein gp37